MFTNSNWPIVSEHRRMVGDNLDLIVQKFADGCVQVCRNYAGESWHIDVLVPRALAAKIARRRLRLGDDSGCWAPDYLCHAVGYGGPGQAFTHEPCRMKSYRKYVWISQSGGLDI